MTQVPRMRLVGHTGWCSHWVLTAFPPRSIRLSGPRLPSHGLPEGLLFRKVFDQCRDGNILFHQIEPLGIGIRRRTWGLHPIISVIAVESLGWVGRLPRISEAIKAWWAR
jgi:hypothetical protein